MPWKPGESGNPLGLPKATREFRDLCRRYTSEALETLRECLSHKDGRVAVAAAKVLLDHGWGRAPVTVHIEGDSTAVLVLTPEQREKRVAELEAARAKLLVPKNGANGTNGAH